jgi:3-oxoacyl-[acyl-carrier protein] reductase
MTVKIKDRVALITGGGSGIGRAIAHLFAKEGARVIINDISDISLREVEPASGRLLADVGESDQVQKMFEEIERRWGRLDILVNSAGIAETEERWKELNLKAEARMVESSRGEAIKSHWDVTVRMSDETWHQMLRVHLNGTFFCTREALKLMNRQNRGSIINLSSTAALSGLADAPHYSAAKAGVLGFTRAVAQEVGSRNIRVNAICPGFVETPMTAQISSKVKSASLGRIPLGRWGHPNDIAFAALFLASDDSSYITGQYLSPNGGMFTA